MNLGAGENEEISENGEENDGQTVSGAIPCVAVRHSTFFLYCNGRFCRTGYHSLSPTSGLW